MFNLPNVLIVAGTGRNVGKTSFVCSVIEQVSKKQEIVAIKISPHFHEISTNEKVIESTPNFEIIEELDLSNSKDSSRMLNAGAKKVFYVQTKNDDALLELIEKLKKYWTKNTAVICESGGLRHVVEPGLFVVCKSQVQAEMKPHLKALESKVDQFVQLKETGFDFEMAKINFENGIWKLKK